MTRDQLRAARILLHIKQPELADLAKMGVATLRRYEGGQYVGEIYAESLQRVVEGLGVVFLEEEPIDVGGANQTPPVAATSKVRPRLGLGIALRPYAELPADTIERLDAAAKESEDKAAKVIPPRGSGASAVEPVKKPRGRPKKVQPASPGGGAPQ